MTIDAPTACLYRKLRQHELRTVKSSAVRDGYPNAVIAEGDDYRVFRIRAVLENSPASEAGLQKGDIITTVNGQSAVDLTLSKLNELFERPVPYQLTIRRGEQILKLTLTPRRLV